LHFPPANLFLALPLVSSRYIITESLNSNTKITTITSTERFQPFKRVNSFTKIEEENISNRIRCVSWGNWLCEFRQAEDWSFLTKINHSMLSHQQNKLHYDGKVAEQAAYLDSTLHQLKIYSTS